MKKLFIASSAIILIYSCGSEGNESQKTTSTKDTISEDTLTVVEDIVIEEPEIEERERLPHMDGDWIGDNLNHPYFKSKKVDSLVALWVEPEDLEDQYPDYEVDYISSSEVKKLTPVELLYYCLAYPSSFSQICAEMDFPSENESPKIEAYLPWDMSGVDNSSGQVEALKNRKKEVLRTLINYIKENPESIEVSYLRYIVMLDGVSAIPTLLETASMKNTQNYTAVLNLIMKLDESNMVNALSFHEELFGEEAYAYGHRVEATSSKLKEIEKLGMKFYNTYKGK